MKSPFTKTLTWLKRAWEVVVRPWSESVWRRHKAGLFGMALALAFVVLVAFGPRILEDIGLEVDDVAAVATAIASFAALAAAIASNNTARDSARALSLATKPDFDVTLEVENSQADPKQNHLVLIIDNMSTRAIKNVVMHWSVRDGSTGTTRLGDIPGRTTMPRTIIKREVVRSAETIAFDTNLPGVDQLLVEYGAELGPLRWRRSIAWTYDFSSNGVVERGGESVPAVRRTGMRENDTQL